MSLTGDDESEVHKTFERSGNYRDGSFHDGQVLMTGAGLVYMPGSIWRGAHMAAASFLFFLAIGQLLTGGVVLRFYHFDFDNDDNDDEDKKGGNYCGAWTTVSGVATLLTSALSYQVWRLFMPRRERSWSSAPASSSSSSSASASSAFSFGSDTPSVKPTRPAAPLVSEVERSYCRDPRRHLMWFAAIALALCCTSIVVDGVSCKADIDDFDECYGHGDAYTPGGGNFECSIVAKSGEPLLSNCCLSYDLAI